MRTIASYSNCLLDNCLSNHIVRVGYNLVGCNLLTIFVYIMDCVAKCSTCPMCVNRRISCNLSVPVKEGVSIGSGVPTVKGITGLCGSCFRCCRLLILFNSYAVCQLSRRIIAINEADRIGRSIPLGIKNQVGSRHLVECVLCRQSGIRIPACKSIVTIYTALRSCGRPGVRSLIDTRIKFYTIDGIKKIASMIIVYLESITVVVEIILRNTRGTGITVMIGIPSNFLCT